MLASRGASHLPTCAELGLLPRPGRKEGRFLPCPPLLCLLSIRSICHGDGCRGIPMNGGKHQQRTGMQVGSTQAAHMQPPAHTATGFPLHPNVLISSHSLRRGCRRVLRSGRGGSPHRHPSVPWCRWGDGSSGPSPRPVVALGQASPLPRLAGVPCSVPGDVSGLPAGLDVLPAFPRL